MKLYFIITILLLPIITFGAETEYCSQVGQYTRCKTQNSVKIIANSVVFTVSNFDETQVRYKITKSRVGNKPVQAFCFGNDRIMSAGCSSNSRTAIFQSYPLVNKKGQLGHYCASLGTYSSKDSSSVILLCETKTPGLPRDIKKSDLE